MGIVGSHIANLAEQNIISKGKRVFEQPPSSIINQNITINYFGNNQHLQESRNNNIFKTNNMAPVALKTNRGGAFQKRHQSTLPMATQASTEMP